MAPFEGYDLPAHRVHLATLAGGLKFIADLQDEEPHLFVAAGTGGGKTATVSVPAAHVRAHGWLVDIIDPKRRSYIDRKTGADVLTNVPGIRVHTDIEAMLWALEEFFLSMLGVNIAVGDRTAYPAAFPQRLLVVDEFGTFASMAARMWRREHGTGPCPAGSATADRMAGPPGRAPAGPGRAPAQRRLFGDSDSRAQYGYRLITGAYSTSLWRMTFGLAPRIEWDTRIKGRGVAGIGEAEELIHQAQLAWMPAQERRRYALTGPTPGLVHRHAASPVDRPAGDRGRPETGRGVPGHCPTRTAGTRTSQNAVRCPARCPSTVPAPRRRPGPAPRTPCPARPGQGQTPSSASPPPPGSWAMTSPTASAAPAPATHPRRKQAPRRAPLVDTPSPPQLARQPENRRPKGAWLTCGRSARTARAVAVGHDGRLSRGGVDRDKPS